MYLGKVVHGNGWYSDVIILYEENYIFDRNILLDKLSLADIIKHFFSFYHYSYEYSYYKFSHHTKFLPQFGNWEVGRLMSLNLFFLNQF